MMTFLNMWTMMLYALVCSMDDEDNEQNYEDDEKEEEDNLSWTSTIIIHKRLSCTWKRLKRKI